jgi:two-component system response regulator FlrC
VKLLRAVQESEVEPLGSDRPVKVDVRIVAATNVDLARAVKEGRFREDLFFRLAVFPVRLPPLRERLDDLEDLANALLVEQARRTGRSGLALAPAALAKLRAHRWPGNIRELANALERAAILAEGGAIDAGHLWIEEPARPAAASGGAAVRPLVELEKEAIVAALAHTAGNRRKAAELLGIGERTLYDKLRKYELE